MTRATTTAFLASLLMLQSIAAIAGGPAAPICGDVNDSGSVNTSDALLVLRKGVGQNITLDCSAYDDRFSACQASLSTATADVASCEADLASTNADLAACSEGAKCGDGIVNSVGEHCDEDDLGDANCATLGHGAGTLACDEKCKFDTLGCSVCPVGSTQFQGRAGYWRPFRTAKELEAAIPPARPSDEAATSSRCWRSAPPAAMRIAAARPTQRIPRTHRTRSLPFQPNPGTCAARLRTTRPDVCWPKDWARK